MDVTEDQSIWHYRQFAEFVAILQNRTIWFSRLDQLKDPLEGRSGRRSRFRQGCDANTRNCCVSCWTIDDEESELMWGVYASVYGVAIRSTKARLKAALPAIVMIEPVDYGTDWTFGLPRFMTLNYSYAFRKERAFKWERELRARLPGEYEYDNRGKRVTPSYLGKAVSVEPRTLMAEVWVAPYAPDWFRDTVKTEIEKYGYGEILVERRSQEDISPALPLTQDHNH